MIFASEKVDFASQWRLEDRRFWPSSEFLATKKMAQTGHRNCSPPNRKRLQRTEKDRDVFLSIIITGYETWVQYTKMTNKMQLCRIIYYSLAALHVSSDIFAHHHGNVGTLFQHSHDTSRQRHTCVIPAAVILFRCS